MTTVAEFYDEHVADEWRRLDDAWIEFAVTRAMIARYVPEGSSILDLGGGPGRYAIELARAGHDVDLVDRSRECVRYAMRAAGARGVQLASAEVGDARDLGGTPDGRYDAVLVLGPMYHLVEPEQRATAISETERVLRPGGVAFFSFLSTYAPTQFAMRHLDRLDTLVPILRKTAGQPFCTIDDTDGFFTTSVFIDPDRVEGEFLASRLEHVTTFGAEGLFAQSQERLAGLPDGDRSALADLAVSRAEDRAAIYASEHIVWVARRRPS